MQRSTLPRVAILTVFAVTASSHLAAQAPPTAADSLYLAIRGGETAKVEALLQGGADVNAKDRRGGATPLMHAAAIGSLEAMKLLIEKGADVNGRSAAGATALMWAAADLAKVRLLLDRGADVRLVAESGRTALQLAAMSDRSADVVRLLLARGADPKAVDKEGMTTLVAATIGNDTETIRQFIDAGVDVNIAAVGGSTPETSGITALISAAGRGNIEAVKLLLARGANPNAVSSPATSQVKNGTIALGRFTPLIFASAFGPASVVRALIDAGADVNAREARGMTALMYAAASDHSDPETIRLLLSKGADPALKTDLGETAIDWARKSGATPVTAILEQAGAKAAPMAAHEVAPPAPTTLRPAVQRGVALLERMSNTFFSNGACGSCHAQSITDVAVGTARRAGVTVDAGAARQRAAGAAGAFGAIATRLLERFDGPVVDILLYTVSGLASADHPPDRATDAIAFNIAAQQAADGHWDGIGVPRPPMADGNFSRTALGIRALRVYGSPARGDEIRERIQRAASWLRSTPPLTAEDRSFRLLGLHWAGADTATLQQAARDIVAVQRADGGWGQRLEMTSDPYATGLTTFALVESRSLAPAADAAQRAAKYLLSTQRADGSWFVRSRAPKFQPYFDGGFPYEHDQWISSMATGWATAALAASLPGGQVAVAR